MLPMQHAPPLPPSSTSVMDPKEQQGTSDIARVTRMRLSTTKNCLRDSNSGFVLEVYF